MAFNWGGAGQGAISGAGAGSVAGPYGAGAGGVLGGLLGGFGGDDPAKAQKKAQKKAMGFIDQIPGQLHEGYDPYINAGKSAMPGYQDMMKMLMENPNEFLAKMGESYKSSPGYEWNKNQTEQGITHANAAGGMAGSPQHEQQNAEMVSGLASKDYNQFMDRIMQSLGIGASGTKGIVDTGGQMSSDLATNLANTLLAKANLSYSGGMNQGKQTAADQGSMFGNIGNILEMLKNNGGSGDGINGIRQNASGAITRY
jgi:hypothetical protein